MGNKKDTIKLRAFTITQNPHLFSNGLNIVDPLFEKYKNTSVKDRMRKRSTSSDDAEHDLIPFIKEDTDVLFGTILRVELDSLSPKIPSELLNSPFFNLTDMPTEEQKSTVYKKHYYFCLNNTHLVTNLCGNTTITSFQTYINWFLNSATTPYEMTPLCKSTPDVKLSDIQEVVFEDNSTMFTSAKKSITKIEDTKNKLLDIAASTLKNLFNDTLDLSEEELKSVVSARLLLKLKKPKTISEEEYQRKFGAIIKPIGDVDDVKYITHKGQRISSSELVMIKNVDIEKTAKGFLDEEQLRQAMILFLNEV